MVHPYRSSIWAHPQAPLGARRRGRFYPRARRIARGAWSAMFSIARVLRVIQSTERPTSLSRKLKPMAEQYIFTIEALHKFYNKREVLKNIWLAFYPGAKIGVIGGNGAGKSTLLRVM